MKGFKELTDEEMLEIAGGKQGCRVGPTALMVVGTAMVALANPLAAKMLLDHNNVRLAGRTITTIGVLLNLQK